MNSKVLVILLVMLMVILLAMMMVIILVRLMVPTATSAYSCLFCSPFFFTQVSTLIFGEYNFTKDQSSDSGFEVVSDIL